MAEQPFKVLFLCTHNSARSILAEAILNRLGRGRGRFRVFSAGSQPSGRVNPHALETLARAGIPTDGARSKSWDEFATPEAPRMDFVFTVCDDDADEACPMWAGQPLTARWGVPDPSRVEGSPEEIRRAFLTAYESLARRIELFTSLRLDSLDRLALKRDLDAIGKRP